MTKNFIGESFLKDLSICDDLINYHKNSEEKLSGVVGKSTEIKVVDKDIKLSTDVNISVDNAIKETLFQKYFNELQIALNLYIEKYPHCNNQSPFTIIENINIQHYKANEGYFAWHCERGSSIMPVATRHLVFMTYLNDVDDEGETEFYYQDLKVKAEKGKTLIWCSDWTHTHRGITSPTQEKYIITGWFNFINNTI